ncbi:hypothetical protein BDF19DRAFT_428413 [Syncephalis fuscata]|nr:hypothetical protein BDF19DRAFT_428413 [Syncephalis fuscata]
MYTNFALLLLSCILGCGPVILVKCDSNSNVGAFDNRLLHCLVNNERARHGLSPLSSNSVLDTAAENHSLDQAEHQFLSHVGSNGSLPPARAVTAANSDLDVPEYITENVLFGATNEQHALRLWMDSPGHRTNILDPKAQVSGIGFAEKDGVKYVTQMFAHAGNGVAFTCLDDDNTTE